MSVRTVTPLDPARVRAEITATLGRLLGLDVDLGGFYRRTRHDPHLGPLRAPVPGTQTAPLPDHVRVPHQRHRLPAADPHRRDRAAQLSRRRLRADQPPEHEESRCSRARAGRADAEGSISWRRFGDWRIQCVGRGDGLQSAAASSTPACGWWSAMTTIALALGSRSRIRVPRRTLAARRAAALVGRLRGTRRSSTGKWVQEQGARRARTACRCRDVRPAPGFVRAGSP